MKFLVIQQKLIGDVLISSLLVDNLRKAFPDAEIDYMVYESTRAVLNGNPNFDNLILFQEKHRKNKFELFKLIRSIRIENYDAVIDAYSKLESWAIVLFSDAKQKISFRKKSTNFLYTHLVDREGDTNSSGRSIIDQRLELLKPLNLSIELETVPKIYVSEEEKAFAERLFKEHGLDNYRKTVMLSIIGSDLKKTYPLNYMAKIIDHIADKTDLNLLFNYFPVQISYAREIYDLCKPPTQKKIFFELLGKDLREFIAIMDKCDMIIGNDGGAINIAKALGKPSFIIFSPWIDKSGWATFEDGQNNISLHLKDFKPELFQDLSDSKIKENSENLYREFTPARIIPKLDGFLENHIQT